MHYRRGLQPNLAVNIAKNSLKTTKKGLPNPPPNQPTPPRRRAVCTRAQGLFAHATAPGLPTIAVTQAKPEGYKYICASDPKNVCTLLAAVPTRPASRLSTPGFRHFQCRATARLANLSSCAWRSGLPTPSIVGHWLAASLPKTSAMRRSMRALASVSPAASARWACTPSQASSGLRQPCSDAVLTAAAMPAGASCPI